MDHKVLVKQSSTSGCWCNLGCFSISLLSSTSKAFPTQCMIMFFEALFTWGFPPFLSPLCKPSKRLQEVGGIGKSNNFKIDDYHHDHHHPGTRVRRKWRRCEACGESRGDDYEAEKLAILHSIQKCRVVACLRTRSAQLALKAARAALEGGINMLEVTMTTPSATQVIKALVQEYPSAIIGEACEARSVGARFLMSPVTIKEMVEAHHNSPVLFVPGAMTITEVVNAYALGAALVKLYPVTLVGGVQFVTALKKVLPHVSVIASHGIKADMVESYLTAGTNAVVLSDAIFDHAAMKSSDFQIIKERAKAITSICNELSPCQHQSLG